MLEYFYKWLVFMSSSPRDSYHNAWELIELYYKSPLCDPLSLEKLYKDVCVIDSENATLLQTKIDYFVNTNWMMYYDEDAAQWRFTDRSYNPTDKRVIVVQFSLNDVRWLHDV